MSQKVSFPTDIKVSQKSKDFILKCLEKDKNKRMSQNKFLNNPLITKSKGFFENFD